MGGVEKVLVFFDER